MNLNHSKIVIAVASTLASTLVSAAGTAASWDLIADGGFPATNIVYINGASAQTQSLGKTVKALCKANQLDVYIDKTDGTNSFIYACNAAVAGAGGLSEDAKFAIVKSDNGSQSAVNVIRGLSESTASTKGYADVRSITLAAGIIKSTASSGSVTGTGTDGNLATYTKYVKSAVDSIGTYSGAAAMRTGSAVYPQIGLSDVFMDTWKARGSTVPATSTYRSYRLAIQGFGVAVSDRLYHLMQYDQKLLPWQNASLNANQSQPSISTAQYASLIRGSSSVADKKVWQNLLPNIVAETQAPTYSTYAALAAADTNLNLSSSVILSAKNLPDALTISRRSTSSGTTAATEMYFLNYPCSNGSSIRGVSTSANSTAQALPSSTNQTNGMTDTTLTSLNPFLTTQQISDSGNTKANDTTVYMVAQGSTGLVVDSLRGTATKEHFSIGVASLENKADTNNDNATNDWKWLKLNGVSPNYKINGNADTYQKESAISGNYTFAYDIEMVAPLSAAMPAGSDVDASVAADVTASKAFANAVLAAIVSDQTLHSNFDDVNGVYGNPYSGTKSFANTGRYNRGNSATANECALLNYNY